MPKPEPEPEPEPEPKPDPNLNRTGLAELALTVGMKAGHVARLRDIGGVGRA